MTLTGIEQAAVIDGSGTDKGTGTAHLTIASVLEWYTDHPRMLQEKRKVFLACVEIGQLYSAYPDADRPVVFNLPLTSRREAESVLFLEKLRLLIEEAGIASQCRREDCGYTGNDS